MKETELKYFFPYRIEKLTIFLKLAYSTLEKPAVRRKVD